VVASSVYISFNGLVCLDAWRHGCTLCLLCLSAWMHGVHGVLGVHGCLVCLEPGCMVALCAFVCW
jgi:hypothetical protein